MVAKKDTPEIDPWEDEAEVPYQSIVPVLDRDFLTVTLKAGTGFDAPWLVFHTNSVAEAVESLGHDQLDELMDLAARKGKEFSKAFGGSQGFSKPAVASSGTGYTKPASVPAGKVSGRSCAHVTEDNPIVKRSGNKNGKDWTGFFCPEADRDRQCTPEFLR